MVATVLPVPPPIWCPRTPPSTPPATAPTPEVRPFSSTCRIDCTRPQSVHVACASTSDGKLIATAVATIESAREPLLATVDLFDLFAGQGAENFGPGRKSLAYSLTYLDKNRTLTAEEVSAAHDRIRERLKSELEVELRE